LRPGLPWTSFIDGQRPAFDSLAIELGNCALRFLFGAHSDEGESPGFASEFILHQGHFLDGASLREEFLQFVFGRAESKISDV
jgi:hypothetical protein